MITWIEKAGLGEKIAAAGHSVVHSFDEKGVGKWITSNDSAVQGIIDGYTLTEAQDFVAIKIEFHAMQLRETFVTKRRYAAAEMASWFLKRAEAKAAQASGQASDAPTLQAVATRRGVTLVSVVNRVLANAAAFEALEAAIDGQCGKHKDAVKAAATFDAVNTYDWRAGWPNV